MIADEVLAMAAQEGDRASFDTLVDRHARRVFLFTYARLRNRHDAEEAAQETFLKVWSARGRFDGRRSFSTWLFAVAYRETVNVMRRRQGDRRLRDLSPRPPAPDERPGSNIWPLAARILDDDSYTALYLHYVTERSPREIAAILGRTGSWARVTLHRARRRLEEALADATAAENVALAMGGQTP